MEGKKVSLNSADDSLVLWHCLVRKLADYLQEDTFIRESAERHSFSEATGSLNKVLTIPLVTLFSRSLF